jgi:chromosomal replication initiator protein
LSARQLDLGIEDPVKALRGVWDEILKRLSTKVNKPTWESFFKNTIPLSYDGSTLILGTPTQFAREWLEKKYSELIIQCAEGLLPAGLAVRVEKCDAPVAKRPPAHKPATSKPTKLAALFSSIPLSDRFTFDSFVAGPCNQFALTGAQTVAAEPGDGYNPLFIHGGVGLGKTHLLQSIGNQLTQSHPDMAMAYVSGETFTSHYVASIREQRADAFRRYYRNVDVWLVDDIQFIAQKERTEEEFYHTLDLLYQSEKQVVICADRAPNDLRSMDSRLISRFQSGLVADLRPPNLDTRVTILENKAARHGVNVAPEVIRYIAKVVDTHVRALEGALIRLIAYSSFMRLPITVQLAADQLGAYFSQQRAKVTPRLIAEVVARRLEIDLSIVLGSSRQRAAVLARQIAMYLARELTDASLSEIGAALGGKDHSTVVHAQQRIKALAQSDRDIRRQVGALREALDSGKF